MFYEDWSIHSQFIREISKISSWILMNDTQALRSGMTIDLCILLLTPRQKLLSALLTAVSSGLRVPRNIYLLKEWMAGSKKGSMNKCREELMSDDSTLSC